MSDKNIKDNEDRKDTSSRIIAIIGIIIMFGLIFFAILLLVLNRKNLGTYIDNQKNLLTHQTASEKNSSAYYVDDLCKYKTDVCDIEININNNGTIIKVFIDADKTTGKSNIRINSLNMGDVNKPVKSFGIHQTKYIVIVEEDKNINNQNNRIVSFYDTNMKLVKKISRVSSDYKIGDSEFDNYECKNNVYTKYNNTIFVNGDFSISKVSTTNGCN